MSKQQIKVLKKIINAERHYFRKCVIARDRGYVSPDLRLVEVGKINGVPIRTAQSLVEMGLAETATQITGDGNHWYIRLASGGVSRIEEPEAND